MAGEKEIAFPENARRPDEGEQHRRRSMAESNGSTTLGKMKRQNIRVRPVYDFMALRLVTDSVKLLRRLVGITNAGSSAPAVSRFHHAQTIFIRPSCVITMRSCVQIQIRTKEMSE
jgi:hypothetical protein